MSKNRKILLIVGGAVVGGAIGFFVWPFGDEAGPNVVGPVVSSDSDADVGESDSSRPGRGEPGAGQGGTAARLSADPDRSDDAAASEDALAARKKKADRKKGKRKDRRKSADSEADDAGPGNAKEVPPAGHFEDDF